MAHTIVEKIACVIFCLIKYPYPVIFFKKAIDCIAVDIPPNDITALESTVFVYIDTLSVEISIQPLVISKNPFITLVDMSASTPIFCNMYTIGKNTFKLFKISIIINAIATIPPIRRTDITLSITLLDKILSLLFSLSFKYGATAGCFLPLYNIPFISAPNICEAYKIYPALGLISIPVPTLPIINIGPEFEVKDIHFFASFLDKNWFSYKFDISLLPTGYPVKILIIKAYDEIGGTWYVLYISLPKQFEISFT